MYCVSKPVPLDTKLGVLFGNMKIDFAVGWRRLQLLEVLIPVFGVGKGDSFSLEPLMKFLGATLGNANADVRAAATRVTVLVSKAFSELVYIY